jgi:hypothetical protein
MPATPAIETSSLTLVQEIGAGEFKLGAAGEE